MKTPYSLRHFRTGSLLHRGGSASLIALLACLPATLHAGTKTWDGGGVSERWASGLPWVGNNPPVAGDNLVWPANGILGRETDNDFPAGTVFHEITITSTDQDHLDNNPGGWTHNGNRIGLTRKLDVSATGSGNVVTTWNIPITLVTPPPTPIPHGHSIDCRSGELRLGGAVNAGTHDLGLYGPLDGSQGLVVESAISGSGELTLGGAGRLKVANTFTGPVLVSGHNGAEWTVHSAAGLGSTAGRTTISGGKLFWLPASLAEPLRMQPHNGGAELYLDAPGGTTCSGDIEIAGRNGSWYVAVQNSQIHARGQTVFTKAFECEHDQNQGILELRSVAGGTITLRGSNTLVPLNRQLADRVTVLDGKVALDVAGGPALMVREVEAGGWYFTNDAELRWLRPDQLVPECDLTGKKDGHFNLNGQSQTVKDVSLMGARLTTGTGTLTVTGDISSAPFSSDEPDHEGSTMSGTLVMTGAAPHWNVSSNSSLGGLHLQMNVMSGPGGPVPVQKHGGGTLFWTGLGTGVSRVEIHGGTLDYSGPGAQTDIRLRPGGAEPEFLGRSCTVRDVSVEATSGTCALIFEDGITGCRNITLSPAVSYRRSMIPADINGFIAATGTVNLAGAKLVLETSAAAYGSLVGSEYMLVRKDSPGLATGQFVSEETGLPLAEGQLLSPGLVGFVFRLSYQGGDGNDVSLKLVSFEPEGHSVLVGRCRRQLMGPRCELGGEQHFTGPVLRLPCRGGPFSRP
jgi:hypothetical protein